MKFHVHRTAISRQKESKPVHLFQACGKLVSSARVLDFGCGYGADVIWLKSKGYDAVGYDTHERFGFSRFPSGQFDAVLMIYVVNILPTIDERKVAIQQAFSYAKPGGLLFVASRTRAQIAAQARSNHWKPHGDGYISSENRCTFQKGHDLPDLLELASFLDDYEVLAHPPKSGSEFSCLLIHRRL